MQVVRMACLRTGLMKRDHLFEQFATAVITLGEVKFTVVGKVVSHLLVNSDVMDKCYHTKYFLPRYYGICLTLNRRNSGLCLTLSNRHSGLFDTQQ